ncbi:MAG: hypothetical protein PHW10_01785 [Candidatus Peribacteraceae bacterium]|nr:hypothetical protein [Candidatus Peribacteraceae bacterium]
MQEPYLPHSPALDQALDPWEPLFRGTAMEYEAYLRGEYQEHYRDRRPQWESHYRHMRTAIEGAVLRLMEQQGKKREDLNVACIGLGLDPAERDLDRRLIENFFGHFERVIVIDFSRFAIKSAVHSLMRSESRDRAGIEPDKVLQMQYDITSGLSTLYERIVRRELEGVDTEEAFIAMAKRMKNLDIEQAMDAELTSAVVEARQRMDTLTAAGELEINGGENTADRPLRLTTRGRQVRPDLVFMPMVVAGTGVGAEGEIWSKFRDVMASTEMSRGNEPLPDSIIEGRKIARFCIHALITAYNNVIMTRAHQQIFAANPDATVLSVTDSNTRYYNQRQGAGTWTRLDLERVKGNLLRSRVELTEAAETGPWTWADDPEHEHQVKATTARLLSRAKSSGAA